MNILYLLIPIALALGGSALAAFIWCARTGQLEDLFTPAYRSLLDENPPPLKLSSPIRKESR
jgi:cbb3-type cytochrome oxidase maturation protein